jgi:hypothetical protein
VTVAVWFLLIIAAMQFAPAASLKALLIDAAETQAQSPALKSTLEADGVFQVDLLTAPAGGAAAFQPAFDKYKLVVLNFGGEGWPVNTLAALDKFVQNGGGLVTLPVADSAFRAWPEFNSMLGLSAGANRTQTAGPFWFYQEGNMAFDSTTPGPAGKPMEPDQPFQITIRNTEHPIAKGLPLLWMHASDRLMGNLRGPGKNMILLATAHSDPAKGGTGHDEAVLLAINYGKGRVFHTLLGRTDDGIACVGFQVTLARGAEWAATGRVTLRVPSDFPGEDKVSTRARK